MMRKVLVIAGPTAVGKSDYAVELAKKYDGFIISGDSIQVYQGFDIGSGKVNEEEKQGVEHTLLDILTPHEKYSAADFQRMARAEIESHDKLPVICGGTGLYLKACLYDYDFFADDSDESVDKELEVYDNEELYAMLVERDPRQAEKIHPHNRRRLLRALTIIARSNEKMSEQNERQSHLPIYDCFIVGCTMERGLLHERIEKRVNKMFESGLQEEIEHLLQSGVTFADQPMRGIGYKEWEPFFLGEYGVQDVKNAVITHSRQFAKRQYTWFRHQMEVQWFDITHEKDEMTKRIGEWLNE